MPMRLEALLRAHGFMKVERPSELWEADTVDTAFLPMLGEMIAASLVRGGSLDALTLNVANVTVPPPAPADEGGPPAGDYVAVSVIGAVTWEAEAVWRPERPWRLRGLKDLSGRLAPARARYGYIRNAPGRSSITVLLPRLVTLPNGGAEADPRGGAAAARRDRRA